MIRKFAIYPTQVLDDMNLNGSELRIYGLLCSYANRSGYCHPTTSGLAKRLGVVTRYVQKTISDLEKKQYLKRENNAFFLPHYAASQSKSCKNLDTDANELLTPDANELLTPDANELLTPDANELLTPDANELLTKANNLFAGGMSESFVEQENSDNSINPQDSRHENSDQANKSFADTPYSLYLNKRLKEKEPPLPPYEGEHTSYDDPAYDPEDPANAQPPYEQMAEESHPELYADPEPPVPATLFQKPSLEQRKATFQTQILDKYAARGKPLPDFILKLQAELEAETAALQQAPDYRTARQIAIDRELQEMNDLAAAKEAARIARREAITQRINRDVALEAEKARLEAEAAMEDSAGEIPPGFAGNPPPNARGEISTHFSGNPPPPTAQKSLTVAEPLLLAPTAPPKPKVPKSLDEIELPAWIPGDLWGRWLDHRKGIKATLTPRAAVQTLEGLAKAKGFGHDPQALMETAIVNGWRGCVFEKHLKPVQETHSRAGQRFQPLPDKDYRAKLEEGYQFLRDMRGGIPILGDPTFDAYQAQQQSQRRGVTA